MSSRSLPLFDTPRPAAKPDAPTPDAPSTLQTPADAVRVVQHQHGPFLLVKGDQVIGEFRLVELVDGSIVREFLDGKREPANPLECMRIHDGLANGEFVEIEVAH